jgi:hypothetical protein
VTVLRRAYVPVEPDVSGFDEKLKTDLTKQDPGGKAGKQIGGQLNRALKRLDLDPIDIKANPKKALAAIQVAEARLKELSRDSATVEVKVQTERALGQLNRFKKQLGDTGDEAGKEFVSKFSRDVGELGVVLDRLNLPPIDITADPDKALKSIAETESALKELSGKSATVEIRVNAEKARGDLERIKKQLTSEGGDEAGTLSKALAPLKSPAVLGTVAAAVAPVVGAAISAAVIGGAGVGGVIGGLLLVKDDPRVLAAGTELGNKLLESLKADASPFVEPVLVAVAKIEARFDQMEGRIKSIFSSSSGFLDPLVNGALDGVDSILQGIQSLVTKGKPVIDALGQSFTIIGESVGKAMSAISGDSDDAASALVNIAKAVGTLIVAAGYLVRGLTEVYGVITYLPGKFKELESGALGLVGLNKDVSKSAGEAATSVAAQVTALTKNAAAAAAAARANGEFVASQGDVKTAQDKAKIAQDNYNNSITALAPAGGRATQVADGLRRAIDALHGAQVSATDANEAYEASWDSLTASIKANGRSLNIHTVAGRSNRDALEAVAAAARDGYVADVQAGIGIAQATKKHDARITALKEEAHRSGLNKKATNDLIDTYGAIPKKKETNLILSGLNKVAQALEGLYLYQRSLATGRTVGQVAHDIAHEKGLPSGFQGPVKGPDGKFYAQGGQVSGWSPHPRADNIPAMLTANEWVHPVDAVDYYGPQIMGAIQKRQVPREVLAEFATGQLGKMGDLPFFATGGRVAPVDTSTLMRFMVNASGTRIPSKTEVAAKVPIGAGRRERSSAPRTASRTSGRQLAQKGYDCSGIVVRGLQRAARPEPVQPHLLDQQPARPLVPQAWHRRAAHRRLVQPGRVPGVVNDRPHDGHGQRADLRVDRLPRRAPRRKHAPADGLRAHRPLRPGRSGRPHRDGERRCHPGAGRRDRRFGPHLLVRRARRRDGDPRRGRRHPRPPAQRGDHQQAAGGRPGRRGVQHGEEGTEDPVSARGYKFGFDWSRAGTYGNAYEDASVVSDANVVITVGRDTSRAAANLPAGTLDFKIDDSSRVLAPELTTSPLYGKVQPGVPARFDLTVAAVTNNLFSGALSEFQYDPNDWTLSGTLLDAWGLVANQTISTAGLPGIPHRRPDQRRPRRRSAGRPTPAASTPAPPWSRTGGPRTRMRPPPYRSSPTAKGRPRSPTSTAGSSSSRIGTTGC